MTELEEITPEGSVAPVYRDAALPPVDIQEGPADVAIREAADRLVAQRSGVLSLISLGLLEAEARAIVGYDGPLEE